MINYGTNRYIFIPSNHKLFDTSLKTAKNNFIRWFKDFRFTYKKQRKEKGKIRDAWSGKNTYDILLNCKYNGYKVIIYPSNTNTLAQIDLNSKLSKFIEIGLIETIIQNGTLPTIEKTVEQYNISILNSILITDEKEFADLLLKKYYPNNDYKIDDAKRHGFNLKLWDGKYHSSENKLTSNDTDDNLFNLLENEFKQNRKIFSVQSVDFVRNQVIYIGSDNDEKERQYIETNYETIKQKFEERNLTFVYFPILKNNTEELIKSLVPTLEYLFPQFKGQNFNLITDFFKLMSPKEYYSFIIQSLQLPEFHKPSILKNLFTVYGAEENSFYYLPLGNNTETDLLWYAENTVKPNSVLKEQYSKRSSLRKDIQEPSYNADDSFNEEALKISDEIKAKIDVLMVNGRYKALAEMVIHIYSNLKDIKPELFEKIKTLNIAENRTKLSQIIIDKNYRIFLPDYGNIEIVMSPLPKTLYLFFLQNPNGILLHDLVDYKKNLLAIYNKVTNSSEPTEIIKRIDDMVDMTNNSINEKCSRIKEAFVSKIDDSLAQHYYVNGKRGEPKKVLISPDLIIFK